MQYFNPLLNKMMEPVIPPAFLTAFYIVKPMVPRQWQLFARTRLAERLKHRHASTWPISQDAGLMPPEWKGWKNGKQFALVLTHDVDTQKGFARLQNLMELDRTMGFWSSFNVVPEKYPVDPEKLTLVKQQGFEIGVHGLKHDGKLLRSNAIFFKRAKKINEYIHKWEASGFRAPSMIGNLELFKCLAIDYDSSTFDTDPFEPRANAVNTVFPFAVRDRDNRICYWEFPYTLPQDSTLFIVLKEKTIDIWKRKLDWIAQKNGMALLNTHPDYMNFNGKSSERDTYSANLYNEFLLFVKSTYEGQFWNPLPRDLTRYLNETYKEGGKNK